MSRLGQIRKSAHTGTYDGKKNSLGRHFLQGDGADLVFGDAGKLVEDGVGDPVDGGVREVEGHPGLALGNLAADSGGGVDGAAAAADDDPLAIGDAQAVIFADDLRLQPYGAGVFTSSAFTISTAYFLSPRILMGASMIDRRHFCSQGCSQIMAQAVGKGFLSRIMLTAPA